MAEAIRSDALRPSAAGLAAADHAGLLPRAAAAMIDGIVVIPIIFLLSLVVVASFEISRETWRLGDVVYWVANTVVIWLYFAGQEGGVRGATFGKRALRLRVSDLGGEPISFARASLRHFAKLASLLPLMAGFLAIAFTARRQGFHDIIAGCLVVRVAAPAEA